MGTTFLSTGSFEIVAGDTNEINVRLMDKCNGTPINLTGWTLFLTAKKAPIVPDVSASLSVTVNTYADPVNGYASFPISSSQTENLEPTKYHFDIRSLDQLGNVTTWANDSFYLVPSIKHTV